MPSPGAHRVSIPSLPAEKTPKRTPLLFGARCLLIQQADTLDCWHPAPYFLLSRPARSVYLANILGRLVDYSPTLVEFLKTALSSPRDSYHPCQGFEFIARLCYEIPVERTQEIRVHVLAKQNNGMRRASKHGSRSSKGTILDSIALKEHNINNNVRCQPLLV